MVVCNCFFVFERGNGGREEFAVFLSFCHVRDNFREEFLVFFFGVLFV